jgi:hypothetical protein
MKFNFTFTIAVWKFDKKLIDFGGQLFSRAFRPLPIHTIFSIHQPNWTF